MVTAFDTPLERYGAAAARCVTQGRLMYDMWFWWPRLKFPVSFHREAGKTVRFICRAIVWTAVLTHVYLILLHCFKALGDTRDCMWGCPSLPNLDLMRDKIKKVSADKAKTLTCLLSDTRGLLAWIIEARNPDRQGSLATLQARALPRFISSCSVAAWPGLHVSVWQ